MSQSTSLLMFTLASLAPHIATAPVLRLIFWGAAAGKVVGMAGVRGAVCSEPGCDNTDGEVRAPLGALGEWFLASHLVSQQYHITPSYLDNIPSRETVMTMALALVLALVLASAGRRHTWRRWNRVPARGGEVPDICHVGRAGQAASVHSRGQISRGRRRKHDARGAGDGGFGHRCAHLAAVRCCPRAARLCDVCEHCAP